MPFKSKYSVITDEARGTHTVAVDGIGTGLVYSTAQAAETAIQEVKNEVNKQSNIKQNERRKEARKQRA